MSYFFKDVMQLETQTIHRVFLPPLPLRFIPVPSEYLTSAKCDLLLFVS